MEGIFSAAAALNSNPVRAKVIAVCGIDTETVVATTSSLIFCKQFKELVDTGLEFRVACQDKFSAGIQLSRASWEPNFLTENPDEALKDADLVVLAADSVATIRRNIISFEAVKRSIERQASPIVRVVSYGLPKHEQKGFKYLFPSWNVMPIPANDLAAVSTILNLLGGGSARARPEDDGTAIDPGHPEQSRESLLSLEPYHAMEVDDRSGCADDYFALDFPPSLESEMETTPSESSPTSGIQPTDSVHEQLLLPPTYADEDCASVEQYLSSNPPEHSSVHLVASEHSLAETERSLKKRKRSIEDAKPEPSAPQAGAQHTDYRAVQQASLSSPETPLSLVDDTPRSTVVDAEEQRKAKNRHRKRAERKKIEARAEAGDEQARKKRAATKEAQRQHANKRRFREQLVKRLVAGKRGMEWFEPLYDACVELAPAYKQTVHALFRIICSKLGELSCVKPPSFDVALYSKYREENKQRHMECPRNSPPSILSVFDTLLSLAGSEATHVLDSMKEVHKKTDKHANPRASKAGI